MTDEPTIEQLQLVARHGSGPLERALAAVPLARRQGRRAELLGLFGDTASDRPGRHASNGDRVPRPRSDGGSVAGTGGPADPSRAPGNGNDPEIVNVVASGSLGRELVLTDIGPAIDAWEVEYGAENYDRDVVYIHRREHSPTLSVYYTGSYHLEGAQSVQEAEELVSWFCRELRRLGMRPLSVTFEVTNVVATGDLGRDLDLNQLWRQWGHEQAEYDPEQASKALTYRPETVDAVFQIHSTGSVNIFGDSISAVTCGFQWLRNQF